MKDPFHAESVTIAAMIILIMASISAPALLFTQTTIASTEGQGGTTTTTTTTTGNTTIPTAPNNATQRVAVGGGNITLSINQFSPQTVEIQPGESVTFFAPQGSIEVHNVIFDLSNGTIVSDIGVPFTLPSDILGGEVPTTVAEELLPAPPYNLGEPIIQNSANGTQAIIGFNKVAFYPAVVDQYGNVAYLDEEELSRQMLQMEQAFEQGTPMPSLLSASHTMGGTESVVSSGIVLDVNSFAVLTSSEEFPPPLYPFLDSFTVTFSQPGTYNYFCAFHPGMSGQVAVGGSMEGQTSQTPTVTSP
jgi:plastocyanin